MTCCLLLYPVSGAGSPILVHEADTCVSVIDRGTTLALLISKGLPFLAWISASLLAMLDTDRVWGWIRVLFLAMSVMVGLLAH